MSEIRATVKRHNILAKVVGATVVTGITYTVPAVSANWNTAYDVLVANSGNWDSSYLTLGASSGDWYDTRSSVAGSSAYWDSAYQTLKNTSGTWVDARSALGGSSGNWNSVFDTVKAMSASWDESADVDALRNDIGAVSANWNSAFNTLGANSGLWNDTRTAVAGTSGNWNSVYNTVRAMSASWDESADVDALRNDIGAVSANWNSAFNTLGANSGLWNDTRRAVAGSSGEWDSAYDTLQSTSASWAGGKSAFDTLGANSGLWNDTRGAVAGSSGNWNSVFSTVQANSALWMLSGSEVDLGDIPASSGNWNSVFATVGASSASWAGGNSAFITLGANSGLWDDTRMAVAGSSGNWDSVYSSVVANSANWSQGGSLGTSSGLWNSTSATVGAGSGNWDSAFLTLGANSGLWNDARSTVENTSADWSSKAPGIHYHNATDITSGNLDIARMPLNGVWNFKDYIDIVSSATGSGTVSVPATDMVTGIGTFFTRSFKVGDIITLDPSGVNESQTVDLVLSDTSIRTTTAFTGTFSGVSYLVPRDGTKLSITPFGLNAPDDATINLITVGRGKNPDGSTAVGENALEVNNSGQYNTAIGYKTLLVNNDGSNNTAVGALALNGNTDGTRNTAVGYRALAVNTVGANNVAIGEDAGYSNIDGNNNIAIGNYALGLNSSGGSNIAIGTEALNNNTVDSNVAIGQQSMYNSVYGTDNTAIGINTLYSLDTGYNNVAIGENALYYTLGSGNVAIGYYAGHWETGSNKFYVDNQSRGSEALGRADSLIYGTFNSDPAFQTLAVNAVLTVRYDATINGITIGRGFNGSDYNTALGRNALSVTSATAIYNTAVGRSAGNAITTGDQNTVVGAYALNALTTGRRNTAMGICSQLYETGTHNTAFGAYSMGDENSGVAHTGTDNSAFGAFALKNHQTGSFNTAVGSVALNQCVIGSGNVAIGVGAGKWELGSNAFYIGNLEQDNTAGDKAYSLMYGTFAGVKNSTTGQQLTVNGAFTATLGATFNRDHADVDFAINAISGTAYFYDAGLDTHTFNAIPYGPTSLPFADYQFTNKKYVDGIIASANALVYKGVISCSGNPNYPSGDCGFLYVASTAGYIGGASGVAVEVGDMCLCNTDSTPSGDQATVGMYWNVIQRNIAGAVVGPAVAVDNNFPVFDGSTGVVIKDSGYNSGSFAPIVHTHSEFTVLQANSGNWDSAFSTLGANSGLWVDTRSAVAGSSGLWNGTRSTVAGSSGNWNSAYTTVQANSASWLDNIWTKVATVISPTASGDSVTLYADAVINGLTVGKGSGSIASNTAVGLQALVNNTTGTNNTAIGYKALRLNAGTLSNTAVGSGAMENTINSSNSAFGYNALNKNTTGSRNTALGHQSLYNNLTTNDNTAVGHRALLTTSGASNIAIGAHAGEYETGSYSFYVDSIDRNDTAGDKAGALLYGTFNTTPTSQTLRINAGVSIPNSLTLTNLSSMDSPTLGPELLTLGTTWASGGNWTGDNTTGFTHISGSSATLTNSVTITNGVKYYVVATLTGYSAGSYRIGFGGQITGFLTASTAWGPTAGSTAGFTVTPSSDFVGTIVFSMKRMTTASTALVTYKSSDTTTRSEQRVLPFSGCTFTGFNAGGFNYSTNNTGFGENAMFNMTTGNGNTALGSNALRGATLSTGCVAIGSYAMYGNGGNVIGSGNIAVGQNALFNVNAGAGNIGIGTSAGTGISSGSSNINIGSAFPLPLLSTGSYNVMIGDFALNKIATVNFNTAIGYGALQNTTTASNIGLGAYAGRYEVGAGSHFYVDSFDRTNTAGDRAKALMYGTLSSTGSSQTLQINAPSVAVRRLASADALVNGVIYVIDSVGDTDFTAIGASANTVGVVFTKSGSAGTGTGMARESQQVQSVKTLGSAPTPTTAGKKGEVGFFGGYMYQWTDDAVVVRSVMETSW